MATIKKIKKAQRGDSTRINMRDRQSMLNSLVQSNADKNKKLKDKPYFDIQQRNPSDTGRTLKDYDTRKDLEEFRKSVGQKRTGGKITKVPNGPLIKKDGTSLKKGGVVKKAKVGAWQRKEGKNPSGGLNAKGVASYRRENPGSKLKTAVTTKPSKLKPGSKSANRRKSFCSRMSGMKSKLTSAKTANDPNSRINKSLRKWNC